MKTQDQKHILKAFEQAISVLQPIKFFKGKTSQINYTIVDPNLLFCQLSLKENIPERLKNSQNIRVLLKKCVN
jgi:hypothetical protein